MSATPNFYEILGVSSMADQDQIGRAFRRRALETHPDKSPHPEAAGRFNAAVRAYETLSDITRRAAYDARTLDHLSATSAYGISVEDMLRSEYESIMDTMADDVLEEYIVGNQPPADTCLLTFFRDLENTEVFVLYRDGKAAFQQQRFDRAVAILERAIARNPRNILYRYYYGQALAGQRSFWRTFQAIKQLKLAIRIGEQRYPPRNCPGVRRALHDLYYGRGRRLRAWWMRRTQPELFSDGLTLAEQERLRVKRVLYQDNLKRQKRAKSRRVLQAPQGRQ